MMGSIEKSKTSEKRVFLREIKAIQKNILLLVNVDQTKRNVFNLLRKWCILEIYTYSLGLVYYKNQKVI